MKKINYVLVLSLSGAFSVANAEVSSTITLTTDYDFRGLTQSARDPALQASLDWEGKSGFYAGMFGSNVDFGDGTDLELDFYAGYRGDLASDLSFDIGALQYTYHSSPTNIDYT